jgi:hypothetical protein
MTTETNRVVALRLMRDLVTADPDVPTLVEIRGSVEFLKELVSVVSRMLAAFDAPREIITTWLDFELLDASVDEVHQ